MSARPRLLFVASELEFGGSAFLAVRHLHRLAPRFDLDLLLVGPSPFTAAMFRELPTGTSFFHYDPAPRRVSARLWLAHEPLAAWFELPRQPPFDRSYQVILTTLNRLDWRACMIFSRLPADRKLIFLTDNALLRHPYYRARERAAIAQSLLAADCVLPVSLSLWRELCARLPLLAERPFQVLRPPLAEPLAPAAVGDLPSPFGAPGVPVVLTVARLSAEKNLSTCIRVHAQLRRAGVDFRWYVIGSGPQEAALRAEIAQHGLTDVFLLTGRQPSIDPWLRHCDLFALFSTREGCPTVVLEALRAGCPVIATHVHGIDEIIDHERTGLIVDHDDESIAAGLTRLLRSAPLREAFRRQLAASASMSSASRQDPSLADLIAQPPPSAPPRVTLLIATYNQSATIDRAIASALMQDFGSFEVVVSDDASTDDTGERARAWERDPRFRYHRNPARLGHVGNYRRALHEHARGDWVHMLDGDDYLLDPGFIRSAIRAIESHAPHRIVFAQAGHRYQSAAPGAPVGPDLLPPIDSPSRLVSGADYLQLFYGTGFFTHLGTLYDRRAAIRLGFYTAPVASSDLDSLLRLALEGDVLLLRTVAGCWMQHAQNLSSNLPLADIPANVRVLRQVAQTAIARGLTSRRLIGGVLAHREAVIFASLCAQSFARQPPRLRTLFRLTALVFAVNPRLLLQPAIARLYYDCLCLLTGLEPRNHVARRLRRFVDRFRRPAAPRA